MTFRKPSFTFGSPSAPAGSTPAPASCVLYFDFTDPVSHLASRMADRAGVAGEIEWRGLELRPPPQPPVDPTAAEWRARHAFAGDHPASPPFIPWTRKAHELCEFARERDCPGKVRRALFRAHFVDRTDIGRIDLLVEIAVACGLDRSETKAALDVDRCTEPVLRNRRRAAETGIADVPALVHPGGRVEGPGILGDIERAINGLKAAVRASQQEE